MKTSCGLIGLALWLLPLAATAAPIGSRLLPMVPEGVQVVSGMKVTSAAESRPQLPLVTHNNNVDFEDWVAMVSVDPQLSGRDLVEAASSSPRGELAERLLLVDGSFDAEHIFRAALKDGASTAEFAGVPVIIILPFPRDGGANVGVRWLAIPDTRTALFGTPLLVQRALNRRAAHAEASATLRAHLKELRPGAEDWGLIEMPSNLFERHIGNAFYPAEVIQALTRSDDVVMGFRYSRSRATIDFVAHPERETSETPASLNARAHLLASRLNRDFRVHLERIAVEHGWISGTLSLAQTRNDDSRELASR